VNYYPDLCLASDKMLSCFFKYPLIPNKGGTVAFLHGSSQRQLHTPSHF